MKKTFKKITAAIMAVSTLAVSMVGMSVDAVQTEKNGTYTTLTSDKNGSAITATLAVKSNVNSPRYGQLSIAYTENGSTTYYTNHGILAYNISGYSRTLQKSASHTYNTINVHSGIYYDGTPYGPICESLDIYY